MGGAFFLVLACNLCESGHDTNTKTVAKQILAWCRALNVQLCVLYWYMYDH